MPKSTRFSALKRADAPQTFEEQQKPRNRPSEQFKATPIYMKPKALQKLKIYAVENDCHLKDIFREALSTWTAAHGLGTLEDLEED